MKIELIKKEVRKKLIKLLPIVIGSVVLFGAAYGFNSSRQAKLESSNTKYNSLVNDIVKKASDYDQSEKMLKEYFAIPKYKLPSEGGYAFGRDRLKAILPIISSLKDTYSFKVLNFALSEMKKNPNSGMQKFELYENSLSIEFAGVTDEYVFSFINDLKHAAPGYMDIKSFTINRDMDITPENINSYMSSDGGGFVSGVMELEWATLGNKQDPNASGDAGSQPSPGSVTPGAEGRMPVPSLLKPRGNLRQ